MRLDGVGLHTALLSAEDLLAAVFQVAFFQAEALAPFLHGNLELFKIRIVQSRNN